MKTELTFDQLKKANIQRSLHGHEIIALIAHRSQLLEQDSNMEGLAVSTVLAHAAEIVILCDALATLKGFSLDNLVEVAFNSRAEVMRRPERL